MARQPIPDILATAPAGAVATDNLLDDILGAKPKNEREIDYPLDRITIGHRLRAVGDITDLARSMAAQGQLQAIVILPDGTLVAGGHRVAAARSLGWTTIRARIQDMDAVDAELAEIDENLYRRELTVLEQAEHLQRRMELLEIKGQRARPGDNQHTAATTTAAVAQTIGISERSAQQRLQIARGLTQEARDALRSSDLAESTTRLLELARQPQEHQAAIAAELVRYPNITIEQAARRVMPHIEGYESYFDGNGYYARVIVPGEAYVNATPVFGTKDEATAAFTRGEYSYQWLDSHHARHELAHGSDHLFEQRLRNAAHEDIWAAWQWRTTRGDRTRTACNKLAAKLRRHGYDAPDLEARARTTYWAPTASNSSESNNTDAVETGSVPSQDPGSRQQGAALAKCSVCNRPLSDPASAIAGVGPCCAAKRAAAAAGTADQPTTQTLLDAWKRQTNGGTCTCGGQLKPSSYNETKSPAGIITNATLDVYCDDCEGKQLWKADTVNGWHLIKSTTQPPATASAPEPSNVTLDELEVIDSITVRVDPDGTPNMDWEPEDWAAMQAATQAAAAPAVLTRNDRINSVLQRLSAALDAVSDYEDITGCYSDSLPFRRSIEAMQRRLETNRI